MKALNDSLVRRFWSHVFENPTGIAVFVKNESRKQSDVLVVPAAHIGMTTVTVKKPPHLALTWRQVGLLVCELMLKLKDEGLEKGQAAAILSWNCPEWVWTDMAVASLGAFSVPIYPNSTSDQVNFILKDSGAKILLGDADDQTTKVDKATTGTKTLLFSQGLASAPDYNGRHRPLSTPINKPNVLKFRKEVHDELARIKAEFDRTAKKGETGFLGINADDIFTLIYTSGSTGVPKGVPLLHSTISAACAALLRHGFDFTTRDIYLSYLPLAHVYERVNGTSLCLWVGVPSAFCRVDEMVDVVKQIKPTVILGVPAVWRKIKDKAETELNSKTGVAGALVKWALGQGHTAGWRRSIADYLVFRKVRAALGGRVRIMLSGGAPIARDILAFFDLISVPGKEFMLRQGYGLTETAGGIAVNTITNNVEGSVGKFTDAVECFILPVSEDTDVVKRASEMLPQSGEALNGTKAVNEHKTGLIFLRGDAVTPGYWNLPEENAKQFINGWFNTGDLGYLDKDGFLWITGRRKRLLKTDGGKYVAPEKLENSFAGLDTLVQYVVPIGDGKPFIGALLFLNQERAKAVAGKTGDAAFYASDPKVLARVAEIVQMANGTLEPHETIKQFTIVPVEAIVGDLLTNKLSIRTELIVERFAHLIEEIYTRKRPAGA